MAIFTQLGHRKPVQLQFRSPVIINLPDVSGPSPLQYQIQWPLTMVLPPSPTIAIYGPLPIDDPPRRS